MRNKSKIHEIPFLTYQIGRNLKFENTLSVSHTLLVANVAKCYNTCGRLSSNNYQNYRCILLFAPEIRLVNYRFTSRNLFYSYMYTNTKWHMYKPSHYGLVSNSKRQETSQVPSNGDLVYHTIGHYAVVKRMRISIMC